MPEDKKLDPSIVRLDNVRLAFPQLWEPKTVNGEGKPAFSSSFILSPKANGGLIKKVQEVTKAVAFAKWGAKADGVLKALENADKSVLHDGNMKADYDGYTDNFYISARSGAKPRVIDKDNKTELGVADGKPYAGCYVNASIQIWAQDNNFGKRINASLRGIQFLRDGDAFAGGAPADESEFEDLSDTGEASYA